MPREAKQHPAPYTRAKGRPTVSMYPSAPGASRCRAASRFSAKTVIIPSRAEAHIQNKDPGPPTVMATPTPRMFPVPREPARAVVRAWKGLTLPRPRASFGLPRAVFTHRETRRTWKNPVRMENHSPAAKIRTSTCQPHRASARNSSMFPPPWGRKAPVPYIVPGPCIYDATPRCRTR